MDRINEGSKRRNAIVEIAKKHGFKGIGDLKKRLLEDYDITVPRQTLYNDLENINIITKEESNDFKNKIVDKCLEYLKELDTLIKSCTDDKVKISAIRAYFLCSKEMATIVKLLSPVSALVEDSPNGETVAKRSEKEKVKVSFE